MKRQNYIFIISIFLVVFMPSVVLCMKKMIIIKPVVSLWAESQCNIPTHPLPLLSKDLPLHNTQLVYGDRVMVLDDNQQGWLKIQAIEQPCYVTKQNNVDCCQGWITTNSGKYVTEFPLYNIVVSEQWADIFDAMDNHKNRILTVSIGTQLQAERAGDAWWKVKLLNDSYGFIAATSVNEIFKCQFDSVQKVREMLIASIKTFLGTPYCWGGRSAWNKEIENTITGVDCSGLVSLVYKTIGLAIPRNSHDQWLKSLQIAPKDLQMGDLVFIKYEKNNFKRVRHVMMFIGDGFLIEASGRTARESQTRIISFVQKFGVKNTHAFNGQRTLGYEIHCGSFLTERSLFEELRKIWLCSMIQ